MSDHREWAWTIERVARIVGAWFDSQGRWCQEVGGQGRVEGRSQGRRVEGQGREGLERTGRGVQVGRVEVERRTVARPWCGDESRRFAGWGTPRDHVARRGAEGGRHEIWRLPELVRLGLVRLGLVRLGLVRLGLVRLGLVRLGLVRLGVVRLGVVRLGVVRLGVVRLGVVRLGLVRLVRARRAVVAASDRGDLPPNDRDARTRTRAASARTASPRTRQAVGPARPVRLPPRPVLPVADPRCELWGSAGRPARPTSHAHDAPGPPHRPSAGGAVRGLPMSRWRSVDSVVATAIASCAS